MARRAGVTRSTGRPAPIVVQLPEPAWKPSYIHKRVEALRVAMSRIYGWRTIRKRTEELREYLIAVAKAKHIERCRYTRATSLGPCGGRIRERRTWIARERRTERFCDTCGRVAA